jgi:hypothetical protein
MYKISKDSINTNRFASGRFIATIFCVGDVVEVRVNCNYARPTKSSSKRMEIEEGSIGSVIKVDSVSDTDVVEIGRRIIYCVDFNVRSSVWGQKLWLPSRVLRCIGAADCAVCNDRFKCFTNVKDDKDILYENRG